MSQTFQARYVGEGKSIDHTPSAALAAGDVSVTDGVLGIAGRPIAASANGSLGTRGIYDFVKVNGAISRGAIVYWDADGDPQGGTAGTGAATTTSTNNTPIGRVIAAAGASDELVRVVLFDAPSVTNTTTSVGPVVATIADPGDGEAIPVTGSGTVDLVTAGAETRTLADPTFQGQELVLNMLTDGGDCVVTAASPINQAGNDTLTFAAVRDCIHLRAINTASGLEWTVVGNDGVALSTA